jgi:hypothetical protein
MKKRLKIFKNILYFACIIKNSVLSLHHQTRQLNSKTMAYLLKSYPDQPNKNRIIWKGDLETMKAHLDEIEKQTEREQLSRCGSVFVEFIRIDDCTLNTCIYKDIDTDNEESIDVNYLVFP